MSAHREQTFDDSLEGLGLRRLGGQVGCDGRPDPPGQPAELRRGDRLERWHGVTDLDPAHVADRELGGADGEPQQQAARVAAENLGLEELGVGQQRRVLLRP
jgi:hypothetical protein